LKTKKSRTPVPITQDTAKALRNYLKSQWRENPQGLLFPNRKGRPCKRPNVVKLGLHPILKKLGIPTHKAGLHAFRHGLGTALADWGHRPQSCSAPYAIATSKPRCGFTFTRTPTHSERRSQNSNHYKCSDYYKKFGLSVLYCGCFGRGGGDRTRPHISKSHDFTALQPPAKSNC
jgi:hypothetical protein